MRYRGQAVWIGALLTCGAAGGCQALQSGGAATADSPPSRSRADTIAPREVVGWSVQAEGSATAPQSGKEVVAADGTLALGTYGSVMLAGLTTDQAKATVENQLSAQLTSPKVTITRLGMEPRANPRTWGRSVVRLGGTADGSKSRADFYPFAVRGAMGNPSVSSSASSLGLGKPMARTGGDPSGAIPAAYPPAPLHPTPLEPASPPAMIRISSGTTEGGSRELAMGSPVHAGAGPILVPPDATVPPPGAVMSPPPGIPNELRKIVMPPYIIEPPDILLIETTEGLPDQPIRGQHLVRPDGTVSLGIYGTARVAGLTIDQAKEEIGRTLHRRLDPEKKKLEDILKVLNVDVLAYNSKFYYVITDGGGYGEQVYRLPFTGSETVLDAIGLVNGLPAVSSKKHIWIARRSPGHGPQVLPVNWRAISQGAQAEANYQIFPGDRVYVRADKFVKIDSALAKALSPIERILGPILLGSQTVNSLKGRGGFGGGGR